MNFTPFIARSFKGRAKLFVAAAVFAAGMMLALIQCNAQSAQTGYLRRSFLRTSYNSDYYSLFEIDGNTLTARGKYADDRIQKIFFSGITDMAGSYKMKVNSDGSYEAEISLPYGYRHVTVAVKLASGAMFGYRVDYSNGWYFSDNGLCETNKNVFDSIIDASPESVGYYLSPTADGYEIAAVLEQIQLISDSVTEGIESDYEKAQALSLYVAEHFYYDHDARSSSVTESTVALSEVLKTARTVCTGFADLYCALLQAQDIDAVNIKGGSTGGDITYEKLTDGVQNHEFTAFFSEEKQRWVWVDSCWNGSGDYENGEYVKDSPHLKFFDISDEALALDHRADYAERRDFFGAKPAKYTETIGQSTEQTVVPEENTPSQENTAAETSVPEDTLAHTSIPQTTNEEKPAEIPEDNTVLIAVIAVLGIAVLGMSAFLMVKFIKGNKS